jgi:hypothetical protein
MIHISHATQASIVLVLLFFVVLPALVASLVSFALIQAWGERVTPRPIPGRRRR